MGLTGGNGEDSEMSAMAQTYPSQVVSPRFSRALQITMWSDRAIVVS